MSIAEFSTLPDDARVWVFGTRRPLEPDEKRTVEERTRRFMEGWTAHDRRLTAAIDLRYDRFLLVAVDEGRAAASGCSIDALMRHVRDLEESLGLSLLDAAPVWYRDPGGRIVTAGRDEFQARARAGRVDAETIVFDPTVDRLGDIRTGRWEPPAGRSWHARLLPEEARPAGHPPGP